jgi:integrase
MARPAGGTILARTLADGTLLFRLRFMAYGERQNVYLHERRDCRCGCGGGWNERTARLELDNLLARVKAGVWRRRERPARDATPPRPREAPSFGDYAPRWLQAKRDGVLGERPLDDNTYADYRWRLGHLLAFFAPCRLDEIDGELCLAFKAHKLREAQELRQVIGAGEAIRDRRGRRARPLGASSIKKLIDTLAALLDEAIEDGHIDSNPARGRRLRIHVPKPKRSFLEIDELAAVEDAARAQEAPLAERAIVAADVARPGSTRARVAARLAAGMRPLQIAADLGLAKSTVGHHLKRLGVKSNPYLGRRAIVTALGRSGVRVSELCELRIGQIRLHDPDGARLQIPDSKTQAGIREVQMSPDLVEELVIHLDRLRRAGHPTGPEAWAFPNSRGGRLSRQRAAKIVAEAAALASERMQTRGLPPLPHVTPHTLRRTYISIALLANNFDVLWVMGQVGHADSKMTLDVYAQLQQRVKRQHGAAFDRLVRRAREQLEGTAAVRTDEPHGEPNPSRDTDDLHVTWRGQNPNQEPHAPAVAPRSSAAVVPAHSSKYGRN